MSSRSPDEFRLGVRPYDRGSDSCVGTGTGIGTGTGGEPEDPHELLHRARRLTAHGHPWAGNAWERAATALRRAGGALTPGDHADALDATALDCRGAARPAAGPLFFRAADLHEQAGQRGKALVSRARALAADHGPGTTACARLTELCERATALHAAGQAGAAETATVHLLRGRARADLLDTAPDPAAEAGALREELTRLIAFAAPHRADPAALGVLADTRALLGRITAPDDPAAAIAHLRAAVEDHRAGGRPWRATEHELLLAAVLRTTGAHEEAAALLRAALASEVPDTPIRTAARARLCLALARTVAWSDERSRTGAEGEDEEVSLLAEAVQHADGPAQDVRVGALARLTLGAAHAERGRYREASALLDQALSGFAEEGDAAARVRARAWLAECALRLDEPARAAREYALAAEEARTWDERGHAAALSHRAAHALAEAGSPEKAARAYERAADLWRAAGDHTGAARSLRARARQVRVFWGDDAAEVVLAEALREAGRGRRDAGEPADGGRAGGTSGSANGGRAGGTWELSAVSELSTVSEVCAVREPGGASESVFGPLTAGRGLGGTVDAGAEDSAHAGTGAEAETGVEAGAENDGEAVVGTEPEAEACADVGAGGPWPGLRELPEPFGPPGRYQVNVYGEVGGTGPRAATAAKTRVQGCV